MVSNVCYQVRINGIVVKKHKIIVDNSSDYLQLQVLLEDVDGKNCVWSSTLGLIM